MVLTPKVADGNQIEFRSKCRSWVDTRNCDLRHAQQNVWIGREGIILKVIYISFIH